MDDELFRNHLDEVHVRLHPLVEICFGYVLLRLVDFFG